MNRPSVDVAVVMRNEAEHLPALIDGLRALDYPPEKLRFLFADNASTDDSPALARSLLAGLDATIVRFPRNLGFAGAYARLLVHCTGEMLALINADAKPDRRWLRALVERMRRDDDAGVCESRQSPIELDKPFDADTGETSWCSAGGMLIRRRALDEVGFFDPAFFIDFEDVDLCWRMWLSGWRCVYVPDSVYEHYGPAEEGDSSSLPPERRLCRVRNRWFMSLIYGSARDVLGSTAAMLAPRRLLSGPTFAIGALAAFGQALHLLGRRRALRGRRSPWVDLDKMSVGVKRRADTDEPG